MIFSTVFISPFVGFLFWVPRACLFHSSLTFSICLKKHTFIVNELQVNLSWMFWTVWLSSLLKYSLESARILISSLFLKKTFLFRNLKFVSRILLYLKRFEDLSLKKSNFWENQNRVKIFSVMGQNLELSSTFLSKNFSCPKLLEKIGDWKNIQEMKHSFRRTKNFLQKSWRGWIFANRIFLECLP